METKACSKCEEDRPKSEFDKLKLGREGLSAQCKVCKATYDRLRYPTRKPGASREWDKRNPERKTARNKRGAASRILKKNQIKHWLLSKYSGVPCLDCDGIFSWCSMDFDHRVGETKVKGVGAYGSWKATPERVAEVEEEIAKCDLICANCHRIRTHERRNA